MTLPFDKLDMAIDEINALANRALKVLEEHEQGIKAHNPALATYITLPCGVQFGWDKHGEWRFVCVTPTGNLVPVKDASRTARIEAAANVGTLIDTMVTRVKEWLAEQSRRIP